MSLRLPWIALLTAFARAAPLTACVWTAPFVAFVWSTPLAAQEIGGGWNRSWDFNGNPGDRLGNSVASAGDNNGDGYDDFLIGAENASSSASVWGGTATLYSGATGNPLFQFNGDSNNMRFGHSVTGLGDTNGDGYDDIAISASGASNNNRPFSGSIYVFSGANGTELLRIDGGVSFLSLGSVVSAIGDFDGDGLADVMASSENGNAGTGTIYIWSGLTGVLLFSVDGPQSDTAFGSALAAAGDVNNDGKPDILVGAPRSDHAGINEVGVAYVYSGATAMPLHTFTGTIRRENLGQAVDGVGDLDQDGYSDFVIGAPGFGPSFGLDYGAATVYSGSTGAVLLRIDGQELFSQLGSGVANLGDFDGDGSADLAVGATIASPMDLAQAGTVAIHSGTTGELLYTFAGETPFDHLGGAIDGGDFNADGLADLIFSSADANPSWQFESGAAYVRGALDPYLTASHSRFSASTGGTLVFEIAFPLDAATGFFQLVASEQSTASHFHGLDIPAATNGLVWDRMLFNPPAAFSNPAGRLDNNGAATCVLNATPFAFSSWVGSRLNFVALCQANGGATLYSSASAVVEITP